MSSKVAFIISTPVGYKITGAPNSGYGRTGHRKGHRIQRLKKQIFLTSDCLYCKSQIMGWKPYSGTIWEEKSEDALNSDEDSHSNDEDELFLHSGKKSEKGAGGGWRHDWCSVDGKFAKHAAVFCTFGRALTSSTSVICTQVESRLSSS